MALHMILGLLEGVRGEVLKPLIGYIRLVVDTRVESRPGTMPAKRELE
jgi:hypothetical protein